MSDKGSMWIEISQHLVSYFVSLIISLIINAFLPCLGHSLPQRSEEVLEQTKKFEP